MFKKLTQSQCGVLDKIVTQHEKNLAMSLVDE